MTTLILHLHHHLLQLLLRTSDDLVGRCSLPAGFTQNSETEAHLSHLLRPSSPKNLLLLLGLLLQLLLQLQDLGLQSRDGGLEL